MTTIYALTGTGSVGPGLRGKVRHYYTTEDAARAALPDLVLDGELGTPVAVEVIEVHGPDIGVVGAVRAVADRAGREAECERRRDAVVAAAVALATSYETNRPIGGRGRALRDAVEALREYAPADTAAPCQHRTGAALDVAAELHELAPLPWQADDQCADAVNNGNGRYLFTVSGPGSQQDDERLAALLVQLVNAHSPGGAA